MSNIYKSRCIDSKILDTLKFAGCVVLEGPRGCGKSTTAEHFAKTVFLLDDDEKKTFYEINSELLLNGDTPILIDEWQNIPAI
jgi:predicted AAA+ superfamily ATPase